MRRNMAEIEIGKGKVGSGRDETEIVIVVGEGAIQGAEVGVKIGRMGSTERDTPVAALVLEEGMERRIERSRRRRKKRRRKRKLGQVRKIPRLPNGIGFVLLLDWHLSSRWFSLLQFQ